MSKSKWDIAALVTAICGEIKAGCNLKPNMVQAALVKAEKCKTPEFAKFVIGIIAAELQCQYLKEDKLVWPMAALSRNVNAAIRTQYGIAPGKQAFEDEIKPRIQALHLAGVIVDQYPGPTFHALERKDKRPPAAIPAAVRTTAGIDE